MSARTLTRSNAPRATGRLTFADLDDFQEIANAVHGHSQQYGNPADNIETDHEDDDMNTQTTASTAEQRDASLAENQPYRGIGALQPNLDEVVEAPTYDVGEDVFDLIDGFGSRSQIAALRALANSALINAIYSTNMLIDLDGRQTYDAEMYARIEAQRNRTLDLYAWCDDECRLLASDPQWDRPMQPAFAFDWLVSTEPNIDKREDEVFEATMNAVGLDEAEKAEWRAERARTDRLVALKRQATMRDRRDVILAELSRADASGFRAELFPAREHAKFFEKVLAGMKKAAKQAGIRRYENAASDAIEIASDAKRIDKANIAFRRRNRDELLSTDELRAMN